MRALIERIPWWALVIGIFMNIAMLVQTWMIIVSGGYRDGAIYFSLAIVALIAVAVLASVMIHIHNKDKAFWAEVEARRRSR